jgi:elongation factor Ts
MAEVTASMVRELRDRTGVAMMDCKSALSETAGDLEKAVELLRKKGQAKQDKLASREAKEGRVGVGTTQDHKQGVVLELNCNTDFTAKAAPVVELLDVAIAQLLANPTQNLADNASVKALITQASQQTGENIQIGRIETLSATGKVGAYSHYTGKVGVLVALTGNPSEELIKDLCLHITATRPLALTREQVPADLVAKERDIAVDQARQTGKPQNIAEKIAEGKMRTFYEERVLLDQKFVKDASKTIAQLLKENGTELEKYVRIEVGQ